MPLAQVDFIKGPDQVVREINAWVSERTQQRIRDLIALGTFDADSRLIIVNTVYLNAPWAYPFEEGATMPRLFLVRGHNSVNVPIMTTMEFEYWKRPKFSVVAIPYSFGVLRFLIYLPNKGMSLGDLEASLASGDLGELGVPLDAPLALYLPQFKLEQVALSLREVLFRLGMKSAFIPGESDFRRIEPGRRLYLSSIIQKAFLSIDERGTEAAAAAYGEFAEAGKPRGPPIEVHVDRPFIFAVQHVPSRAFLFLGRVTDPR